METRLQHEQRVSELVAPLYTDHPRYREVFVDEVIQHSFDFLCLLWQGKVIQQLSHRIINGHSVEANKLEVGLVYLLVEGFGTSKELSNFIFLESYLLHLRFSLFILPDEHGDVVSSHLLILEVVLAEVVDSRLRFFIEQQDTLLSVRFDLLLTNQICILL